MNIIHQSSLASYPIGYSHQTQTTTGQNESKTSDVEKQTSHNAASTPAQIERAIAKIGLAKEDNFSQNNDEYTNKALQAYNQTRNQPLQAELDNIISGVDFYA
ncbi:MAG: hypothetical protein ACU836_07710 [Gammaproteobacteria bacterium]